MAQVDGAKLKAAYAEAMEFQKVGKDEDALKRYAAILDINANIAEVHFQVARIFLKNDRLEKSLRHIKAAAKLRPGVLDIWKLWSETVMTLSDKGEQKIFLDALEGAPLEKRAKGTLSTSVALTGKSKISIGRLTQDVMERILRNINAGKFAEAEAMARDELRRHPKVAALYDAIGISQSMQDRDTEAMESLEQAIRLEPNFPKAHTNYARVLKKVRRAPEGIRHCNIALRTAPGMVDALVCRAECFREIGRLEETKKDLFRAMDLAPKEADPHYILARILFDEQDLVEAVKHLEIALKSGANEAASRNLMGMIYAELGRFDEAIEQYEISAKGAPDEPRSHRRIAELHQTLGNFDEAQALFERSMELDPDDGQTHRIYLTSQKIEPDDPIIQHMEERFENEDLDDLHRANFGFALAKVMEDQKRYDEVFKYLHPANALMRRSREFDMASRVRDERALLESYQTADWSEPIMETDNTYAPIFVTGMPRSGTTLVEQIISSHSTVEGGGEVGIANRQTLRAITNEDAKLMPVNKVPRERVASIGVEYERMMRSLFPDTDRVTDKSIQTFTHIGLIKRAMPNARFIVVRRDPRDNLLSIYKNVFPEGAHYYSYNLTDLAREYHHFVETVDYWRSVRPDWLYEIQYEALVSNPEEEARKLIDACGLEWEDACLNFHQSERRVKTLSLYQVRQPMYKSSTNAWERYGSDLDELMQALGPEYVDAAE